MVICSILFFVSKIIFWQATDFAGFLLERIILSIVVSGLSGVDTSILYLSCSKEKSQHIFGVYNSLSRAGLLLASFIFIVFLSTSYKLSAFLTIITYGIAAILSLFITEVKTSEVSKEISSRKEFINILNSVFRNKYLLMFILGIALLNETHQTVTVFLNQVQFVKSGMTDRITGGVFILVNIAGLLSALSLKVTKIVGAKKLIPVFFILMIAACLALAVTSSAVVSIIGILVIRIVFALFQPLQTDLLNRQVTSVNRATVLSVFSIIGSSAGVGTNLIFGAVAEIDISIAFYCAAAFGFIGLILTDIWAKKTEYIDT